MSKKVALSPASKDAIIHAVQAQGSADKKWLVMTDAVWADGIRFAMIETAKGKKPVGQREDILKAVKDAIRAGIDVSGMAERAIVQKIGARLSLIQQRLKAREASVVAEAEAARIAKLPKAKQEAAQAEADAVSEAAFWARIAKSLTAISSKVANKTVVPSGIDPSELMKRINAAAGMITRATYDANDADDADDADDAE